MPEPRRYAAADEGPGNIHNAWEVKPQHYAVVFSSPNQRRDRVVSTHPSLFEAIAEKTRWDEARKRAGSPNDWGKHHVFAVYPDRSAKIVGYESDGYHEAVGGNYHPHTRKPDFESIYYRPPHTADAAPVSLHRLIDNTTYSIAEAMRGSPMRGFDVGPDSEVMKFIRPAMETGDMTSLGALADYLEERGVRYTPDYIRRQVQKFHDDVDNLRWHRQLRVSPPARMSRRGTPARFSRADEQARARRVDLITLPNDVDGTRCGNCVSFDRNANFCRNPKVRLSVSARDCCNLWSRPGTTRPEQGPERKQRRVLRFAKAERKRDPAHPSVEGFPIEFALRHLANDPDNPDDVRNVAKTVLTGGGKPEGSPEGLWALNDLLQEHGHPGARWYNWLSAADKLTLDKHTGVALRELSDAAKLREPNARHDEWRFTPEAHASRIHGVLNGNVGQVPFGQQPANDRALLDYVRRRVAQLAPNAKPKDVDESITRHKHRADIVWRRDHGVGNEGDRERAITDVNEFPAQTEQYRAIEKASRYARNPADAVALVHYPTVTPGRRLLVSYRPRLDDDKVWRWHGPVDKGRYVNESELPPGAMSDDESLAAGVGRGQEFTDEHAGRFLPKRLRRVVRFASPRVRSYWLSPHGEMHEVGDFGHESFAKSMGTDVAGLQSQGWGRVVGAGGMLTFDKGVGDRSPPSPRQMRSLTDHAIEHGYGHVWHGVTDRPLWSAPHDESPERLDRLPGGRGDDRPDSAFDPDALAAGTRVEMEHTRDPRLAREIAKDHLTELGTSYYTKLKEMEGRLRKGNKKGSQKPNPVRLAANARGDFIDSLRRVRSRNQDGLRQAAQTVAARLGLKPSHTLDALYNSPGGATPGLVHAFHGGSPEAIDLFAAYGGLLGNARGVARYDVRPYGPDRLYYFKQGGAGDEIRYKLARHGLPEAVMIPPESGGNVPGVVRSKEWGIMIPDPGGANLDRVRDYAKTHGVRLQVSPGFFRVMGSADQATARAKFRDTVAASEGR